MASNIQRVFRALIILTEVPKLILIRKDIWENLFIFSEILLKLSEKILKNICPKNER